MKTAHWLFHRDDKGGAIDVDRSVLGSLGGAVLIRRVSLFPLIIRFTITSFRMELDTTAEYGSVLQMDKEYVYVKHFRARDYDDLLVIQNKYTNEMVVTVTVKGSFDEEWIERLSQPLKECESEFLVRYHEIAYKDNALWV